jgi:NAD(P)H-dependent FMN reductase
MGAAQPHSRILLVSGSTRGASTNSALLRTAAAGPPDGVVAELYAGMTDLPHFNPDDDHEPLPPAVADLRTRIGAADAVLICTPEYAGALPGTFKNLLDWSVGGPEMYGKPVAWVNASGSPTRAAHPHASLEIVLRTVHADIVTEACAHVAVSRQAVGADGLVGDPNVRSRIREVLTILARHAADRGEWTPG